LRGARATRRTRKTLEEEGTIIVEEEINFMDALQVEKCWKRCRGGGSPPPPTSRSALNYCLKAGIAICKSLII